MSANVPGRRRLFKVASAAGLAVLLPGCRREPPPVSTPPRPSALRLDLRHSVSAGAERFDLVQARAEPHWNASRRSPAERLAWGDYRLRVYDPARGTLIFQDGFDSNLDSASQSLTRLALRMPMPERAVDAAVEKRRAESAFHEIWRQTVDPARIEPPSKAPQTRVDTLLAGGKAGVAILGDGYTAGEYAKFSADARRAADYLFSVEPLRRHTSEFIVSSVFVPSAQSGITDGYLGVARATAFGCRYGAGEQERTLYVGDEAALRDAAALVPYDFLLVLANAGRYGGSAYFGGPAVVAIDSAAARYLVLHECAHAIAGLAEEYYVPAPEGPVYRGNIEPWQPNVTTAAAKAKWSALGPDALALRSWNKAEYERYFARYVRRYFALREQRADESAIERLMAAAQAGQAALLARNQGPRRVGLYEGANGYGRGMFRAEVDCIMFSLQTGHFCRACELALERAIDERCGR